MAKHAARDAKKESFWRRMIRQQASSGMSIRAWCRKHGVNEAGFYWWRRELARRDAERKPSTRRGGRRAQLIRRDLQELPATRRQRHGTKSVRSGAKESKAALVPVHVTRDTAASDDGWIEIALADGRHIRLTGRVDRQVLADVLDVLERRAC